MQIKKQMVNFFFALIMPALIENSNVSLNLKGI